MWFPFVERDADREKDTQRDRERERDEEYGLFNMDITFKNHICQWYMNDIKYTSNL